MARESLRRVERRPSPEGDGARSSAAPSSACANTGRRHATLQQPAAKSRVLPCTAGTRRPPPVRSLSAAACAHACTRAAPFLTPHLPLPWLPLVFANSQRQLSRGRPAPPGFSCGLIGARPRHVGKAPAWSLAGRSAGRKEACGYRSPSHCALGLARG